MSALFAPHCVTGYSRCLTEKELAGNNVDTRTLAKMATHWAFQIDNKKSSQRPLKISTPKAQ
jgi:hypothetical protein